MDRQKVDIFIKEKQFCFPQDENEYIRNLLSELEEEKFEIISDIEFINPDFILLSSIYLGSLGVDRFMVVDIYLGFLKLLTLGFLGMWTIADWFVICKRAEIMNFKKIMSAINTI